MKKLPTTVQETFLISNEDFHLPNIFFHGYCFQGVDFISDQNGFLDYIKKGKFSLDDGYYLLLRSTPTEITLSTDANGFYRLYYYSENGKWVVSNSFQDIIKYLKERNVPLTLNKSRLDFFKTNLTMSHCHASFETTIEEIKLLPSRSILKIDRLNENLKKYDDPEFLQTLSELPNDSATLIKTFVKLWVSRYLTILKSGIRLEVDSTGGVDSRVSFSLFWKAYQIAKYKNYHLNYEVRTNGSSNSPDKIASDLILDSLNVKRNPQPINYDNFKLKPHAAYEIWRTLNIGSYTPTWFPFHTGQEKRIKFSGNCGEKIRPYYAVHASSTDLSVYMARYKRHMDSLENYEEICGEQAQVAENLTSRFKYLYPERASSPINCLCLHYREFNDRFHSGNSMNYGIKIQPLSSILLEKAINFYNEKEFQERKLHFDVISSIDKKMLFFPYDDKNKYPAINTIPYLLDVSSDYHDIDTGEIFGGFNIGTNQEYLDQKDESILNFVLSDLESRDGLSYADDVLGRQYVQEAISHVQNMIMKKHHPNMDKDGVPVNLVLFAKLIAQG